jgi:hypothetical protein
MKMAFSDSYQTIQSYEKFKKLINQRGLVLLQQEEPSYCKRFRTCETLRLKPSQTLKECNPLLSGKFSRFVDLLESLYEVGYYWKRLTETSRLLEANVPETPLQQMNEASWFIYNLDFYWHTVYSLQERLIRFLTIFRRMYKLPSPEEAELLEKYVETFKIVQTEGTKVVRDPLAHYRSQAVQGWRNDHQWEAALLRNDNSDFIEGYDKNYLQHKDFYLGYIRTWVPQYYETLSIMFDRLSTLTLDRLELK